MDRADMARVLIAYDTWATRRLLAPTDGFSEPPESPGASWGSVEGSMRHVLQSHSIWLSRWTNTPPPRPGGEGFPALAASFDEIHAAMTHFVGGLTDHDCGEELEFRDSRGDAHREFLSVLISHAVNHGTYHRGEAALLLTGAGRSPGDLDLVIYRRLMEPGR